MIKIHDDVALKRVLNSPLSSALRLVLATRAGQLVANGFALRDLVCFVVVEPGDAIVSIIDALGFSPLTNLVDGAVYGTADFTPSFEWALDHGGVIEAPFILSDDGFGWVLLVADEPGVNPDLLAMLHEHAVKAEPLSG